MVLVGAADCYHMNATSNSADEIAKGRSPAEMSRPTATTRSGFMESHGSGVQILMSAQLAIEMGVPIYGVIALATTASDKVGRSIPAPGQGVSSHSIFPTSDMLESAGIYFANLWH
jgi:3-oxoacyl-(acyl-carrier-protein) synthase